MLKTLCLTTFAIFAAHVALADDVLPNADSTFAPWGEAEGWNIFIDASRGTCLAERVDDNTNVVQMGVTKDKKFGYFGVFTQLAEIKDRKEPIVIMLGDHEYVADIHTKTANLADGYVGGYILTDNPAFVDDVMNMEEMTIFPKDDFAFKVSLAGTKAAIEAATTCTTEQPM